MKADFGGRLHIGQVRYMRIVTVHGNRELTALEL